ncbi:hypothetical protein HDU86_006832 [Geranomyces michiganensis]|nr:hypothetical protein HDU86_006832 [Geranomyces michiganensis]
MPPKQVGRSISAPNTPGTAAHRTPKQRTPSQTLSRKKSWVDATEHDLSALKLSPLQQRLRKENASKYTAFVRGGARSPAKEGTGPTSGRPFTFSHVSPSHPNTLNASNENAHRPVAISKLATRPPSPTSRLQWGLAAPLEDIVDFDEELETWERTNRAIRMPARRPLGELNISANKRTARATEHKVAHKGPKPTAEVPTVPMIPSEDLFGVAVGIMHLTNALASQLDGPYRGRSIDDLPNEDEMSIEHCSALVRDLTNQATKYVCNNRMYRDEQEEWNRVARQRITALEDRVAVLELALDTTQSETSDLRQRLNAERKENKDRFTALESQLSMMLKLEEDRAVEQLVALNLCERSCPELETDPPDKETMA